MTRIILSQIFVFPVLLIMLLAQNHPVSAQSIEIQLHQVEELSEQFSPYWQQFENRLEYNTLGEQAETARLNPSIAYDLEFLGDGSQSEYEHYLYLQKAFRTPGHYRNLKERRDARIQLLQYNLRSERDEWLSATRFGFIRILLGKREIEILDDLKSRIAGLTEVSAARAETGEESLLDDQLLQMSQYQLQTRIEERKVEIDRLVVLWRNRMGINEQTEIIFSGDIDDIALQLPGKQDMLTFLELSPLLRGYQQAVDAAALEESVARSARIPSIELTAGYKQLNPNWRGFLFGISVPLPLLSANSESISQAQALQRIEQTRLDFVQKEKNQITLQLLDELRHYESILDNFPEYLHNKETFLNRLISSYEEGTLSLSEFLNSLNMMADTYQTRFSQLTEYYGIASELEALTGQEYIIQ